MIYNRLFHNRFLREEAIPGSEGEGPGGGAPPPASPVDSPPPAAPPVPPNPYDFQGVRNSPIRIPAVLPRFLRRRRPSMRLILGKGLWRMMPCEIC